MTQIRSLTTRDMYTVIGMLKKIADTAGGERLSTLFTSVSDDSAKQKSVEDISVKLGFLVLSELYNNLITDLQEWFASLCSGTVEAYLDMPPETTLEIIEQLAEGEQAKGFFSKAWQLYKKMQQLSERIPAKSRK